MSNPPTDFAEQMADFMTTCYASTRGCKRFPVRIIHELDKDNVINMVCLCPDHAATYQPEGRVLSDFCLEGDNLKAASEAHW